MSISLSPSVAKTVFAVGSGLQGASTMFQEEPYSTVPVRTGHAFIYQTSAALYTLPSSDAEIVKRLGEGTSVDVLPGQTEAQTGWLFVRTQDGQSGFLRTTTKLTTREQLQHERAAIQRSNKIGIGQMAAGSLICLCGIAATVGTYLLSEKYKAANTIYIFYGAVIAGGGQLLWGMEQTASSRHMLKQFDTLWQAALT